MRVLHVDTAHDWGGGQNQVRLLVSRLAGQGVHQLCICRAGSELDRRLRAESLPVEAVSMTSPIAFARHIYTRASDYDLVHAHDAFALRASVIPARLRRRALLATRRTMSRTRPRAWRAPQRVIAVSDAVAHRLRTSGVRADRIRVIPSAIDVDEVISLPPASPTLRERLLLAPDAFVVGNVGPLLPVKHQVQIPRIAARLRDLHWVIIGEGPERPAILESIKAHGVGPNVRLPGRLPDARRYLQELDAFVFPSVDEALGTSVLDAMARGVPVVAADSAGPAEILRPVHDLTGVSLFPPDDADTAAAHIQRIREDAGLRRRVIGLQNQRVRDFRIERLVESTLRVYREVLDGR
mgnify:CR=1 FL=1